MTSGYLQAFPVPQGFYEILADFTRDILRDQPTNILEYATLYFESREKSSNTSFKSLDQGSMKTNINLNAVSLPQTQKQLGTEKSVTTQEVKTYVKHLPSTINI